MVVELKSFAETKNFMEYDGVSGIYAMIYNNEVIYVGQSNNVRRRLLSHHSFRSKIKHYKHESSDSSKLALKFYTFLQENEEDVYFLVVPGEVERLNELEEHYISKYQPKYNWSGVHIKFGAIKRYI